jgi:hypothetical protein
MIEQTWYARQGSWLAEFWTLLHLPYTLMAICFVIAGFTLNGHPVNWPVAAALCVAYFLGLGITAHCLDQLPGMGTVYVKHITPVQLVAIGAAALMVSILIGVWLIVAAGIRILLPLMVIQTFFAFAYPMKKLFDGYFHTDGWFALGFGFIPFITGYAVAFTITGTPQTPVTAFFIPALGAMICYWISLIEILLSRFVRQWRSNFSALQSNKVCIPFVGDVQTGIDRAESALKILCLVIYASTLFLLLW